MRPLFLLAAATLLLSASTLTARADDTYTTYVISASGDGSGLPEGAYTANGIVTIDTTSNTVSSYYIQDSLGLTLDSSIDNPTPISGGSGLSAFFGVSDVTIDPSTSPNTYYDYLLTLYMSSPGVYAVCTTSSTCATIAGEYVGLEGSDPYYADYVDNATLTPTPEPSSLALLATGMLGASVLARRRWLSA